MQDNPNITDDTGSNKPYFEMDHGDWQLAFEAFKDNAFAAKRMGFNLRMIHHYLDAQLFKPHPVMEALDLAMEVLFPYTDFHKASFDLFLKYTDAGLTFQEEEMLKALGVKF